MILCVDYGERYVGVAITDAEEKIALRHSTIDQSRVDAVQEVTNLVASEKVGLVLVGVPLNLSGEETPQTHVSLAFMEKLQQKLGEAVSIESVDETLTSVEAESRVKSEGGKKHDAHAEAARLMLADYLRQRYS